MVQNSGRDPKAMAVRFHCVMLIRENERARTKAMAAGIREGYPKTEAVMPQIAHAHHRTDERAIDR